MPKQDHEAFCEYAKTIGLGEEEEVSGDIDIEPTMTDLPW